MTQSVFSTFSRRKNGFNFIIASGENSAYFVFSLKGCSFLYYIGQIIKSLRHEAGMSQEKVAERLGVTNQAVSKWELGQAYPDIALLRPLAELFGVTVDFLLEDSSPDHMDEVMLLRGAGYAEVSLETRFGIFRDGLRRMPRNTNLLSDAIGTGYLLAKTYRDARDIRAEMYYEDTVTLCNRQLEVSHDVNELNHAKFILALLYAMFGRTESAEELARQFPLFGSTVTSAAVRTAVTRASGSAAGEIAARIDSLEQMLQAATSEMAAIKQAYARLTTGNEEDTTVEERFFWDSEIIKFGENTTGTTFGHGDRYYYAVSGDNSLYCYDFSGGTETAVCDVAKANLVPLQVLCAAPDGSVWLLARDAREGQDGVAQLKFACVTGLPDNPEICAFDRPQLAANKIVGNPEADRNGNLCFVVQDVPVRSTGSAQVIQVGAACELYVYRKDGSLLRQRDLGAVPPFSLNPLRLADGRVAFYREESQEPTAVPPIKCYFEPVNPETGEWDERIPSDYVGRSNRYSGQGKYLFFYSDFNSNLYGFNSETGKSELLFSGVDAGVNLLSQGLSITVIKDGSYRCVYTTFGATAAPENRFMHLEAAILTRRSATDERTALRFAAAYTDTVLQESVINFNRENNDIRIDFWKPEMGSGDATFDEINNFVTGLVAGTAEMPDVLLLDGLPHEYLATRGLFADLKPYLEADSELGYGDIIPSMRELIERDGKIFCLAPGVILHLLCGKPETAGTDFSMTYDDMIALAKEHPGAAVAINKTGVEAFRNYFAYNAGDFINWETGETRFTDGAYEKLLELCKLQPPQPEKYDAAMNVPVSDALEKGEFLLDTVDFNSALEVQSMRGLMGGDFVIKPYPSVSSAGLPVGARRIFAISAQCANKDAAWQFVRSLCVVNENQSGRLGGIPVFARHMKLHTEQCTRQNYTSVPANLENLPEQMRRHFAGLRRDESGRVMQPVMTRSRGMGKYWRDETLYAATEEDCELTVSLLGKADHFVLEDGPLFMELYLEAQKFFDGEMSAKEVAASSEAIVRARYRFGG